MDSKKRCHVCGNRVGIYLPLAGGLLNKLSEYNYNLQTNPLETCNLNEYQCPYCGATDRDRLQAIFLDEIVKNNDKFSILEISPSTPISDYIHKHFPAASHLTMDLYRTDLDYQLDITDMYKSRDEQFDLFLCSHVLEHVPDDQKAISELYRILKKGGQGVILVPLLLGVDETDGGGRERGGEREAKRFIERKVAAIRAG